MGKKQLVIDGSAVYEIDECCMAKKNSKHEKQGDGKKNSSITNNKQTKQ